jgi:hypothetical protein
MRDGRGEERRREENEKSIWGDCTPRRKTGMKSDNIFVASNRFIPVVVR